MAGPQTVWGIDVGKCALKAIKLRMGTDKSVEAVAADYIEHEKILSQPDADKDALWAAALEKFLSRNDISGDKIVVSVPGQPTLTRFSKLPPVEKKKIPDIVRYEADQQIPFDMDEVVWDYQIFQVPESPEVEVGIFAMKRELIRDYLLHFTNVGLEPIAVQSAPLALYNSVHFDGLLSDGAAILIDIGTEDTNLLVASANGLWSRSIPVGGNNFTEALVKSFKLSFDKAETLKRTAASSKYARQIFQAMRPVFADLVQEVQRSVGFYSATHRDVDLERVIGLGSAFKLPGLQKYLQQNLQLNVDRWESFKSISVPTTPDGEAEQSAAFVVPFGLALQGLGFAGAKVEVAVTSSLLPPEIAKQVVWRKKRPFFAAAAACLLLSAGTVWMRQISDSKTLEANNGEPAPVTSVERADEIIKNPPPGAPRQYGKTILAAAQKLKSEHSNLANQGAEELKKIETVQKLLENRTVWLNILAAIDDALPTPQEQFSEAKTGRQYREVLESGQATPRDQRKEISIVSFDSKFVDEVDKEEIEEGWNTEIPNTIANEQNTPRPGFIVTMRCRTPFQEFDQFVSEDFRSRLIEVGRKEKQGFYVNRVGLQLLDADSKESAGGDTGNRSKRSRRGRGGSSSRGGSGRKVEAKDVDPVTDEDSSGDRTFQITMDIVLQDLPEKKEENPQG